VVLLTFCRKIHSKEAKQTLATSDWLFTVACLLMEDGKTTELLYIWVKLGKAGRLLKREITSKI